MKKAKEVANELLGEIIFDWAESFLNNPCRFVQVVQNHSIKAVIHGWKLQREEGDSAVSDEERCILH